MTVSSEYYYWDSLAAMETLCAAEVVETAVPVEVNLLII